MPHPHTADEVATQRYSAGEPGVGVGIGAAFMGDAESAEAQPWRPVGPAEVLGKRGRREAEEEDEAAASTEEVEPVVPGMAEAVEEVRARACMGAY